MLGGVIGTEIVRFLGACEPVCELDPEILSTPDCATVLTRGLERAC